MEADQSREELVRAGAEQDGVEIEKYEEQRPRSRWLVPVLWTLAAVFGGAAVGVFLFWPAEYVPPGEDGHFLYLLYTPVYGGFLGLAVLSVAAALILTVKRLLPVEEAVQQRHLENGSSEQDRARFKAIVQDAVEHAGLNRRSVFRRTMVAGTGALGATLGIVGVGAFVRDPWNPAAEGHPEDTLWHTGWYSRVGEKVYLRVDTGEPTEVKLITPADLAPGGQAVVFPFRETDRDEPRKLARVLEQSDNPATLYHLPADTEVEHWPGREGMNYGQFYAYSRVCTHLGCPVGEYETAMDRAMCPCHQSQFSLIRHATPIFGPAARPLPQLPISVDSDGYFIALGDFTGPIGPGFWEDRP